MRCNLPLELPEAVGGGCSGAGRFLSLFSAAVSGLPRAAPELGSCSSTLLDWALSCGEDFTTSSFAFWSFSVQVSWQMTVKS